MRIIAFAGQARCGKTTFARSFAAAAYDAAATPVIRSFAGPLKRAAAEAGFDKETNPIEYRDYCQTEGAARRSEDPDYWLNQFRDELADLAAADAAHLADALTDGRDYHETIVLIDDLRYENEFDLVRETGGQVCLVMRPDGRLPEADAPWRDHESEEFGNYWASQDEAEQDGMFDMVFVNDVPSEDAVMRAGKTCFTLTMMEAMTPRHAIEEEPLDDDDDAVDATLDELLDLFRQLKEQADEGFGLTDENIELEDDDDEEDIDHGPFN
jgi:hypothetical protein